MDKRMTRRSSEKSTSSSTPKKRSKSQEAIFDLKKKIPDIDSIFNIIGRIGNGTFSTVLLGTLKKENGLPEKLRRKYAIKHHVPTSHPDRIIKELKCMVEIGGKDNVVGINCTIRNNESVAFIMPYLPHDRFHDFYNKMHLEEIQCFMKNLLIALRRVHKFNIIHRDVKPSNFLYNRRNRQFLLVDFGLAQQVPSKSAENPASAELKRRERDYEDASVNQGGEGDAKRKRCVHNEARFISARSPTETTSTPFKMPLQQLNTIATPSKTGKDGQFDSPLSRHVKSAILGVTMTDRLQQKVRSAALRRTENKIKETQASGAVTARSPQYNTNRNLNETAAPKCFCYGNPQVCNICLIRKEVHASRAGTPGYRPPEVLLKYADQTTAVDMWAVGVILLSILSAVYPFFKAPDDYVALAEMVTIFGDKAIRRTAFALDRLVTLSQHTKPLDLRKLCVRLRNHKKFSSPEMVKKYQRADGTCEMCKNCEQFFYNCLCEDSHYVTEPLGDDPFPLSAYDLLRKLLELNPHKRITAEEALKHPFFDAVDVTA